MGYKGEDRRINGCDGKLNNIHTDIALIQQTIADLKKSFDQAKKDDRDKWKSYFETRDKVRDHIKDTPSNEKCNDRHSNLTKLIVTGIAFISILIAVLEFFRS